MNVKPIPDKLLGDTVTLISPTPTGFIETPIANVRVERTESTEHITGENTRGTAEITVWADRVHSTWAEFPTGARVRYGNELFEITTSKIYSAGEPHHCKFTARKTGEETV